MLRRKVDIEEFEALKKGYASRKKAPICSIIKCGCSKLQNFETFIV
jgi:hypothetical protein